MYKSCITMFSEFILQWKTGYDIMSYRIFNLTFKETAFYYDFHSHDLKMILIEVIYYGDLWKENKKKM